MELFFSERLECFHCHGGFNFSDSVGHQGSPAPEVAYHNNGLYNLDGKGAYPHENTGLFALTGKPRDMGRFKAPTLRNIAVTSPYMHDGSVATLEEVLDPRLRGRVASPTAQYSSGRWIVQLAVNNGGSEKNVEPAFEFLRKLKPNIVTFVVGTDPIKVLQSGEAAVTYLIFSEVAKLLAGPDSLYRFVLPEGKPVKQLLG